MSAVFTAAEVATLTRRLRKVGLTGVAIELEQHRGGDFGPGVIGQLRHLLDADEDALPDPQDFLTHRPARAAR